MMTQRRGLPHDSGDEVREGPRGRRGELPPEPFSAGQWELQLLPASDSLTSKRQVRAESPLNAMKGKKILTGHCYLDAFGFGDD